MSLTNTQAQDLIAKQMKAVASDKNLTNKEKAILLARLNNSFIKNSHVDIRATRLVSTMGIRKQSKLPATHTLLNMPVLK